MSPTGVDSLPLKAVAVTPLPPGVKIAKGGIRGSTNQFVVLAEAGALVSKDVDQIGASSLVYEVEADVLVVNSIVQQEVSVDVDAVAVFAPAQLPVENSVLDVHSEAGLKLDTQEEIAAEVVQVFSRLLGASDSNVFVPSVGILEELISSSLFHWGGRLFDQGGDR
ncbi:hypothetical protein V6N11_074129 [Hibiscus sabdariffa]|uniref:Uncharacterized protein n=1 Tax=Hibiscus sabdariffa TaxID=183260 RepID=A0ABR2A4N4_9ROSI